MPWPLRMVLYVSILFVLFLSYFSFRYFRSLSLLEVEPLWIWKTAWFLLVIFFLAFPIWGVLKYNIQGSYSVEDFPHFIIYLFWFGFVFSGVMLNGLILHDILLPLFSKFSSIENELLRIRFAKGFLIFTVCMLAYTTAKMVWDTNRITIEHLTYHYSKTTSQNPNPPLKIVHITDIHADVFTHMEKMERYVQFVNEANPDLVIFTGDLITEGIGHVQQGEEALQQIKATYGVYAVIGDHDYWAGQDHITHVLQEKGIKVLRNEQVVINHDKTPIHIAGVTEIYSYHLEKNELQSFIQNVPDEGLKIVATHQASDRLIEFSKNSGSNILLSGHTHGGQVRIPVFFYPFTAARSETKYVKGHWMFGNMLLNVNSGLGFTLSPVRYNAPAQISVIEVE